MATTSTSDVRRIMVKKRLASGRPCDKCAQAEAILRDRGLWERIDDVVWADETDPKSPGHALAAEHGVTIAPFFLVESAGAVNVYKSVLSFIKKELSEPATVRASTELDLAALDPLSPPERIERVLKHYGSDCAIAFSGAEDVVLIDMAANTGQSFSVFCLDTGRLHPETYAFIERVREHYRVGIDVMSPNAAALEALVSEKGLFSFRQDGHHECCGIRKVEPLGRALRGKRAWMTGQRRDQSPATRDGLAVSALDAAHGDALKLNPLADWSSSDVWKYIRDHDVPYNALHDRGYVSIGCEPCTRALRPGEHERAARWWWEDATKRECGLHLPVASDD